jgi:hypothetical protein
VLLSTGRGRDRLSLLSLLLLAVFIVGAFACVDYATAQGKRQTVIDAAGATSAQLSFTVSNDTLGSTNVRVRIERQGAVLVDGPLSDVPGGVPGSTSFPPGEDGIDGLFVHDLDGDGEPEVQVDLFSGGANCCLYSTVFAFDPDRGSYAPIQEVWGAGYRLRDLNRDGRPEFVSSDHRLKYIFACNACQRLPPRVAAFSKHGFHDVTRRFPGVIRRNARLQLRLIRKHDSFTYRGAVASLTADRCLLGRCPAALRKVRRLFRAGLLDKQGRYDYPPWGRAYVRRLSRVLRRFGYR